ncbi:AAA family ATPase [Flavobacterium sp. SUN052]|uniref:AAA family ATPase n=1 Tax=Flavobacterium sp. SUN052 TaxID=3002441 RepID=UPI00237D79EE|nr:AAA family ATPase [Flavobacterium sp. SUN052]MEC4003470.1 AAA family ATPase [Flavobacterium sp. SUN052]
MKKTNPISFLEDSFLSIKNYIEEEFNPSKVYFDAIFVSKLKLETTTIINLCNELNNSSEFVNKVNSLVNSNTSNGNQYKAQEFFLSDIISIYNQNSSIETEKSRFVLAYYFDALKNNHFADEKAITTLNKLITDSNFCSNLENIRAQNRITSINDKQNQSFLLTALSETKNPNLQKILNSYENFAHLSFNLSFDKEATKQILESKKAVANSNITAISEEDTLEKVLEELHQLVGLDKVKQDVNEIINLLEVQKKRELQGLKNIEIMLHTVFIGPPGTGKTTVARLLGRIFKHLGYLSKGQLYETDREGMIAGYVGQTATKVNKVVEESKGGVLFIDEAYGLNQNGLGNDYGAEAVNTLLKRMEDFRDDLAVVVAGYNEPMQLFIASNPGLRSRFNRYFFFEHFTPSQLIQIFESFCQKSDFILTPEALEKISDTFELLYQKKDDSFGNARVARNIFEKCVQNQANRIVKIKKISKKALKTITEGDIPEPTETVKQVYLE